MKITTLPRLYPFGIRFPKITLMVALVVTFFSILGARALRVESDLTQLLPSGNKSVQNFNQLKEYFGGMGFLVVTVESEDPALAEQFAGDFAAKIEQHPDIYYVDYRSPTEYFKKRYWLYLEKEDLKEMESRIDRALELQKIGVSPFLSKWIGLVDKEDRPDLEFKDILGKYEKKFFGAGHASPEEKNKLSVLWVKAKEHPQNLEASRRLVDEIRQIERQTKQQNPQFQSLQVGYTGDYVTSGEEADFTKRQIARVSAVVMVLLLLILFLYFQRLSAVFLVGIPLALGMIWTGGLVYLLLGHLNVLTGFSAAILAGLGSDYGIYLLTRYNHEREIGHDFSTSCRLAFSNTGRATFGSMVTTVAAFVSLFFSDFGVFIEFGIVGALGLLLNYLAMMLVLPSLLTLREQSGWKPSPKKAVEKKRPLLSHLFNTRAAPLGVLLAVFLIVLASFTIPAESKIYFEDGQMQTGQLPGSKLQNKVTASTGNYLTPTILIHESPAEEEKTVEILSAGLKTKSPDELVYSKVAGLSNFVPKDQAEKKQILGEIAKKFEKISLPLKKQKASLLSSFQDSIEVEPITREGIPKEIRHRFESLQKKGSYAVYLYSALDRGSTESMRQYRDGVLTLQKENDLHFIPVDSNFITYEVVSLIEREAPRGLFLILLFLLGFAFLIIRPWKRALILGTNMVGSLVLLSGVLWLVPIPLNVMNVVVFPIILGTGIDCFIHLNHRYDETKDMAEALRIQTPSILISNLTTIVGFGGLLLTSSVGLRSIGWVAILGLALITLMCLWVFPRCLALLQPRTVKIPEEVVEKPRPLAEESI